MSASLVGSEMCIRDSRAALRPLGVSSTLGRRSVCQSYLVGRAARRAPIYRATLRLLRAGRA
eukprot:6022001-Alexandrium_andersonii.AAC.1